MTKKDYELIAKAIAHARAEIHRTSEAGTTEKIKQLQGLRRAELSLANALAGENLRFDIQRFLTACLNQGEQKC